MSASRVLIACWLALAGLSVGTVTLGQAAVGPWVPVALLVVAVAKAWLIADGFMELRHAPRLWRGLIVSWALVLAVLVGAMLLALR